MTFCVLMCYRPIETTSYKEKKGGGEFTIENCCIQEKNVHDKGVNVLHMFFADNWGGV